ncbi:MAG TPA: head GIN domain-containing protein [Bacteroidia bacterium]|nr:head GIN domain-containing protein [Bacteroidia bacterium]
MRFLIHVIIGFLIGSCAAIPADHGPVIKEARTLAAFKGMNTSGVMEVDFTPAEVIKLSVEAPEDILKKVITEVDGKTLKIYLENGNYELDQPIKVHVEGPDLQSVKMSGATRMVMNSPLNGNEFDLTLSGASTFSGTIHMKKIHVDLSGASKAEIAGTTRDLIAGVSGAAKLKAGKLSSSVTEIKCAGASTGIVRADSTLIAEASGVSSISYSGNAKVIEKETSGYSSIHRGN